jgi:hypothetical protein
MKTKETKKRNSAVKSIISIALAALLCMTMSLPVFASGLVGSGQEDKVVEGTEAAITKKLDMPVGTPVRDLTFTFVIEKIGFNDVAFSSMSATDSKAIIDTMPYLGAKTPNDDTNTLSGVDITFTSTGDTYTHTATSNGTQSFFKETADLFKNVTWAHEGVYTYKITEEKDTNKNNLKTDPSDDGYTESMTYSEAEYRLSVWVVKDEATGKLVVKYIGDIQIKTDAGTDGGEKVDPTPGNTDEKGNGPYSKMIFTNTYIKNNGEGPTITNPKNTTLKISKTVGNGGSWTQYFNFDITVKQPTILVDVNKDPNYKATYKAYVMEADGSSSKIVRPPEASANYSGVGTDGLIEFTSGELKTINLKHGQWLAFTNLPVGSEFTVTEKGATDYTPSCKLAAYSELQKKFDTMNFSNGEGKELIVPDAYLVSDAKFGKAYVGDNNNNAADFTNTFKTITPTGIGVDDLPYIVIIGVVLAVAAGYVVFRIRRSPKEEA